MSEETTRPEPPAFVFNKEQLFADLQNLNKIQRAAPLSADNRDIIVDGINRLYGLIASYEELEAKLRTKA